MTDPWLCQSGSPSSARDLGFLAAFSLLPAGSWFPAEARHTFHKIGFPPAFHDDIPGKSKVTSPKNEISPSHGAAESLEG